MNGQGLIISVLPTGNLSFKITEDGKEYLESRMEQPEPEIIWKDTPAALLWDLMESYLTNGSYQPIPSQGLTEAPCVAHYGDLTHDDEGQITGVDKFWYFGNYMIVDEIAELYNGNEVIFTLVK